MTTGRKRDPGGVLDSDRGSSEIGKAATILPLGEAIERDLERAGQRDLDQRLESMPGLSRAVKDAQRITPRATVADLGHPRKERTLGADGQVRQPLSGRQMKDRSKSKRRVLARLPERQYAALKDLAVDDSDTWTRLNDALSDAVGDPDLLEEADRRTLRRVDAAIQAYEGSNDRGHVLYVNVEMPKAINRTSLTPFVTREYEPGERIAFDRYTGAVHSLHEASERPDPAGRTAVFEIQTRRGIYLGQSEGGRRTGHLLPRAMTFRVQGVSEATYRTPSGDTGKRLVIQLIDTTEGGAK